MVMIISLVAAVVFNVNAALIIIVSGAFGAFYYNVYKKEGKDS